MEQNYYELFVKAYEQFINSERSVRVIDWDEIETRPGNRLQYLERDDEE